MGKTIIDIYYTTEIDDENNEMAGANFIANIFTSGNGRGKQLIKTFYPYALCEKYGIPRTVSGCPSLFGQPEYVVKEYEDLLDHTCERLIKFNNIVLFEHPDLYEFIRPQQIVIEMDDYNTARILRVIMPFDMSATADQYLENVRKTKGERQFVLESMRIFRKIAEIISQFHKHNLMLMDIKLQNFVVYESRNKVALIDYESVRHTMYFSSEDITDISKDIGNVKELIDKCAEVTLANMTAGKADESYLESVDLDPGYINAYEVAETKKWLPFEIVATVLNELSLSGSIMFAPDSFLKLKEMCEKEKPVDADCFVSLLNATMSETYDWKVFGALIRNHLLNNSVNFGLFYPELSRNLTRLSSLFEKEDVTNISLRLGSSKSGYEKVCYQKLFSSEAVELLDIPSYSFKGEITQGTTVPKDRNVHRVLEIVENSIIDSTFRVKELVLYSTPYIDYVDLKIDKDTLFTLYCQMARKRFAIIAPKNKKYTGCLELAINYVSMARNAETKCNFNKWMISEQHLRNPVLDSFPNIYPEYSFTYFLDSDKRDIFESLLYCMPFYSYGGIMDGGLEYFLKSLIEFNNNQDISTPYNGLFVFYNVSLPFSDNDLIICRALQKIGIAIIIVSNNGAVKDNNGVFANATNNRRDIFLTQQLRVDINRKPKNIRTEYLNSELQNIIHELKNVFVRQCMELLCDVKMCRSDYDNALARISESQTDTVNDANKEIIDRYEHELNVLRYQNIDYEKLAFSSNVERFMLDKVFNLDDIQFDEYLIKKGYKKRA